MVSCRRVQEVRPLQRVIASTVGIAMVALWAMPMPRAQSPAPWPDSFLTRLQALALIQSLNAEILGSRSATLVLEKWCRDHRLAADPRIGARVAAGAEKAATAEQRERLQVSSEPIKYRRVQLHCGGQVLSEAENWYVPGRLTPEMNRLLETTDTPFGIAVRALAPYRQTFDVRLLWSPLPAGWEHSSEKPSPCATTGPLAIPDALFEHRALLYAASHTPFAEVREVYQRQILAFAAVSPCG